MFIIASCPCSAIIAAAPYSSTYIFVTFGCTGQPDEATGEAIGRGKSNPTAGLFRSFTTLEGTIGSCRTAPTLAEPIPEMRTVESSPDRRSQRTRMVVRLPR